jgi:hypothetical protein
MTLYGWIDNAKVSLIDMASDERQIKLLSTLTNGR